MFVPERTMKYIVQGGVNNMNDEREIRFIYSEKIDEKVFNRILELMKELIISIQEEKMNKE